MSVLVAATVAGWVSAIVVGNNATLDPSQVRSAWEAIFRNSAKMRIEMKDDIWHNTIGMVTHHAIQWIYVGEEPQPRGPVFVTNVFLRAPQGWRMLVHHASPLQMGLAPGAGTVVLH